MSKLLWSLALVLLNTLLFSGSIRSQDIRQLTGRWVATVPAEEDAVLTKDGLPIRFRGRPAYTVTLNFKANNSGYLQWGDSAKAQVFNYKLVNSKLIELRYAAKKPWRLRFTFSSGKLYLGEYPSPKEPQESIDLLYTLAFTKQP
jgi:hypothetical protein